MTASKNITPEEAQYLAHIHPDARQQWLMCFRNPRLRGPAIYVATASKEALQQLLKAIEAEITRRGAS